MNRTHCRFRFTRSQRWPMVVLVASLATTPGPESSAQDAFQTLNDVVYDDAYPAQCVCDLYLPAPSSGQNDPGPGAPSDQVPSDQVPSDQVPGDGAASHAAGDTIQTPSVGVTPATDPTTDGGGLSPAVVIIHGGGWITGDKWTTTTYSRMLAQRGYVVMNINYRLAPRYPFPAQVDDVRAALVWLRNNAPKYRIDLDRIGLFGYSAGGHLSILVGVLADESPAQQRVASGWAADDPRWDQLPAVKTICAGGPPCDFRALPPTNRSLAYFLGGSQAELPEIYIAASPTAHTSAGDPPIQIIHGDADMLVPIQGSELFQQSLSQYGVACQLKVLPKLGHMITFMHPITQATMLEWFAETL